MTNGRLQAVGETSEHTAQEHSQHRHQRQQIAVPDRKSPQPVEEEVDERKEHKEQVRKRPSRMPTPTKIMTSDF